MQGEVPAMRDKGGIMAGLVVFLALLAFPIWYTLGSTGDTAAPELERPADGSKCVEGTAYMTANHMDLLDQWRDAVVREGRHEYTSTSGEKHVMSLTGTCMSCHKNRETFCARCHEYANVQPTCWHCHLESKGN
jgi:hypothetical protein